MKRLLLIPILCFFLCSTLWAGEPVKESLQLARMNPYVAGATVAATGAWYYTPGISNDAYSYSTATLDTAYPLFGYIAPSASGNVTKLSVKISNVLSATECKLALYDNAISPAESTRIVATAGFTPANGWNDVSVSSTAVTASTQYKVVLGCNSNVTDYHDVSNGAGGYINIVYTSFPPATSTIFTAAADYQEAVRMWID